MMPSYQHNKLQSLVLITMLDVWVSPGLTGRITVGRGAEPRARRSIGLEREKVLIRLFLTKGKGSKGARCSRGVGRRRR